MQIYQILHILTIVIYNQSHNLIELQQNQRAKLQLDEDLRI